MADTTRNTFNRLKNYVSVIFQRGSRAVVDNELNELQDISLVSNVEAAKLEHTGLLATSSGSSANIVPPMVAGGGSEWTLFYSAGSTKIKAGVCWVDGYALELENDVVVSLPSVPASDTYGAVYIDVVISEVDSTIDPNIATPNIGETTRRNSISYTVNYVESLVSHEAAINSIPAFTQPADARLWKGHQARIWVCNYFIASGGALSTIKIKNLARVAGSVAAMRQIFAVGQRGAGATGDYDSMVMWDASTGKLQIGTPASLATHTQGLRIMSTMDALSYYIARTYSAEWLVQGGSGADGTQVKPDLAGQTWVIADGSSLCFWADSSATTNHFSALSPTASSDQYDVLPVIGTAINKHAKVTLTVRAAGTLNKDSGGFVVCRRAGNDLVWWNGHVTRGSTDRAVIDEPTSTGRSHDVTVSVNAGKDSMLFGRDSIERSLNFLTKDGGSGTMLFGTARSVSIRAREGQYQFAQGVRYYGTESEVSATTPLTFSSGDFSLLEIIGDGCNVTSVKVTEVKTSARTISDLSTINIAAGKIVLKGISFTHENSSDLIFGYLMSLFAGEVVIEDCTFDAPLRIRAHHISIKRCSFVMPSDSATFFPALSSTPLCARALYLSDKLGLSATLKSHWIIEDSTFSVTQKDGVTAAVVVDCGLAESIGSVCHFNRCSFNWEGTPTSDMSAGIHVAGRYGKVVVNACSFLDHPGWKKTPTNTFSTTYATTALHRSNGASQTVACGYISCIGVRDLTSSIEVVGCYFGLNKIANGYAAGTATFCLAALAILHNNETVSSEAFVTICNVLFERNTVDMCLDSSMTRTFTTDTIYSWAVLITPTFENYDCGAGGWTYQTLYKNIRIKDNQIDLGGGTVSNLDFTWRTVPSRPNNPAGLTVGFSEYSSAIQINLKNVAPAAVSRRYGVRTAEGVVIEGNYVGYRSTIGTGSFTSANHEYSASGGIMSSILIALDFNGVYGATGSGMDATPTVYGTASYAACGAFFGPVLNGNTINNCYFYSDNTVLDIGVLLAGTFYARVVGNLIHGSQADAVNEALEGIRCESSYRALISGNIISNHSRGVRSTGASYVSKIGANVLVGNAAFATTGGGTDDTFDTNANFN